MEIVKKTTNSSLSGNSFFADPYILELLISGFVGNNIKARLVIHEFIDKNLQEARENETRLQGQLGQAQDRRQSLEVLDSVLELLDLSSVASENKLNYQNILSELKGLTQRLKRPAPTPFSSLNSGEVRPNVERVPVVVTNVNATEIEQTL